MLFSMHKCKYTRLWVTGLWTWMKWDQSDLWAPLQLSHPLQYERERVTERERERERERVRVRGERDTDIDRYIDGETYT